MEVRSVDREWWDVFKHYHYLTDRIPNNAYVYVGFIKNEPVAVTVFNKFPHPVNKDLWKIARTVVLPHWQGFNIGYKLKCEVARRLYNDVDLRATSTLPIVQNQYWNSDEWILRSQMRLADTNAGPNAKFAQDHRDVYMETYRFLNDYDSNDKIARTKIPKEERKYYTDRHKEMIEKQKEKVRCLNESN